MHIISCSTGCGLYSARAGGQVCTFIE